MIFVTIGGVIILGLPGFASFWFIHSVRGIWRVLGPAMVMAGPLLLFGLPILFIKLKGLGDGEGESIALGVLWFCLVVTEIWTTAATGMALLIHHFKRSKIKQHDAF